ncbi:uncharacterized protein LACBIDRAFT_327975 [Laccaria bicolor S238N-H82]|uniref:Predicted protein n=1 Tax=Laccaria bicolor (strain S238N-H82 / ATCC MYA-4686) TaxID=486041 RepID=B0DDE8_LACBS|nr:uncharacterized protein LACBIDRAFT_327975 [Laccaria bicolor S238N-H82]EDR07598.1 predicted protein [Laccaria bicolor S238N-H82]|eukprot:XP_001881990.1 predicted protein [Laccaria bicolor S238N-H82]
MLNILPNGKSFKKEERSAVKKDIREWFAQYSQYIPPAWRSVNGEGNNFYKFLDPSKFPMEMVTEALQFWYERQEQHKVAFRFKSFLEGKMLLEAPPRRKIKVHVPKPHVHSVGKGKKPCRSKGQRRGRAATESPSDEEARPKRKEGVEDQQFNDNSWKDLDVDKPAKKQTEQFSKDQGS